ncbi:BlaI/MecI/CopY family transcriptional regulator [Streptomyces monomycini]|uniref:BlaI/MecI/CopY family transcriptional regulator n=1 Tax=Streptomyces monomycini TaxID=371720 RepID=UPI00067AD9D5|nr:BlaI/MecI/CopY family transcriptional regulator [Streptomyces monomycini]
MEAQVLAALHQAPGPATAAWVQDHLGDDLAYTTVMTILSRLHAKKAVTRERVGRSYVWTPAADEAGLAALRMRRVLDSESDRDAVLASFVSALSAQDEQLLRTLLERATGEDPGHPTGPGPGTGRPPHGD